VTRLSNFLLPTEKEAPADAEALSHKLMVRAGLIRFHEILDTKTRNFFFNGWPHTTAVIREKQADQALNKTYAVDSWFYDNGQPAVIVPLEQWKSGWKPENSPAR
jgi:hypothetical protein